MELYIYVLFRGDPEDRPHATSRPPVLLRGDPKDRPHATCPPQGWPWRQTLHLFQSHWSLLSASLGLSKDSPRCLYRLQWPESKVPPPPPPPLSLKTRQKQQVIRHRSRSKHNTYSRSLSVSCRVPKDEYTRGPVGRGWTVALTGSEGLLEFPIFSCVLMFIFQRKHTTSTRLHGKTRVFYHDMPIWLPVQPTPNYILYLKLKNRTKYITIESFFFDRAK